MSCRGVHFAISDEDLAKLLGAASADDLLQVVQEEIEQRWDEEWLFETDKGWEAIHRCLTDGKIGFDNGEDPWRLCILGGRQLQAGDDYIVSLKTPQQVSDIAVALQAVTVDTLRKRYFAIPQTDYDQTLSEEELEYVWDCFKGLPEFFARAATAKRHVIFTVDQ